MKLKNIFISVLAVLVCSACSEDDNSSKKDKADATLSVTVKTVGTAKTKAFHPNDENELDGEAKVNSLAVLIFDENGAELLGYGWLNTTGSEGGGYYSECGDESCKITDCDRFECGGKYSLECRQLCRF